MMPEKKLLTVPEYAAKVGRVPSAIRRKIMRNALPGAVKMGRDWFIPEDTPYDDRRVRSGKYTGWRKKPSDDGAAGPDAPSVF